MIFVHRELFEIIVVKSVQPQSDGTWAVEDYESNLTFTGSLADFDYVGVI